MKQEPLLGWFTLEEEGHGELAVSFLGTVLFSAWFVYLLPEPPVLLGGVAVLSIVFMASCAGYYTRYLDWTQRKRLIKLCIYLTAFIIFIIVILVTLLGMDSTKYLSNPVMAFLGVMYLAVFMLLIVTTLTHGFAIFWHRWQGMRSEDEIIDDILQNDK